MSQNDSAPGEAKEANQIKCRLCSAKPRLAHKILNVRTGGSLRMYKCECGDQIWIEHPK
jgi:hypothetical protein